MTTNVHVLRVIKKKTIVFRRIVFKLVHYLDNIKFQSTKFRLTGIGQNRISFFNTSLYVLPMGRPVAGCHCLANSLLSNIAQKYLAKLVSELVPSCSVFIMVDVCWNLDEAKYSHIGKISGMRRLWKAWRSTESLSCTVQNNQDLDELHLGRRWWHAKALEDLKVIRITSL